MTYRKTPIHPWPCPYSAGRQIPARGRQNGAPIIVRFGDRSDAARSSPGPGGPAARAGDGSARGRSSACCIPACPRGERAREQEVVRGKPAGRGGRNERAARSATGRARRCTRAHLGRRRSHRVRIVEGEAFAAGVVACCAREPNRGASAGTIPASSTVGHDQAVRQGQTREGPTGGARAV